jgi:hypothetical protein
MMTTHLKCHYSFITDQTAVEWMSTGEEKVICPTCQKGGYKSLVFIFSFQGSFGFTGGYYDYDGNWVQPLPHFAPWYQCSRGHIWQKLK